VSVKREMSIKKRVNQLNIAGRQLIKRFINAETDLLLTGRLLSEMIKNKKCINSLEEIEFKVFSQFGDDGIIQWLVNKLDIGNKTFIEFGVEDYRESNTRFLLMNNNWSGLIMDGSKKNIVRVINSEYYWKYNLTAVSEFITRENINSLITQHGVQDCGLLHIDIDGNDYWIWKELSIRPEIVILEYNSVFGKNRAITVPYRDDFNRTIAHFSNLYFGASLKALVQLSNDKGYAFIGCNSAGNNAYFIRRDKLCGDINELSLEEGYVESKFRESRDINKNLTFLSGKERVKLIAGLPIYNTEKNALEDM
jgi:hypothetical protein